MEDEARNKPKKLVITSPKKYGRAIKAKSPQRGIFSETVSIHNPPVQIPYLKSSLRSPTQVISSPKCHPILRTVEGGTEEGNTESRLGSAHLGGDEGFPIALKSDTAPYTDKPSNQERGDDSSSDGDASSSDGESEESKTARKGELSEQAVVYPAASMEPKVQIPHVPLHGKTPRRIEVERRKRQYASQDIGMLLSNRGLPNYPMESDDCPLSKLVLSLFDDTDVEPRSPEIWMATGRDVDGNMIGIPGKAVTKEQPGKWYSCTVLSWDYKTNMLEVRWEEVIDTLSKEDEVVDSTNNEDVENIETKEGVLSQEEVSQQDIETKEDAESKEAENVKEDAKTEPVEESTETVTFLPRLQVVFLAEDPEVFADRIVAAYQRRSEAEAVIRYNLSIDCMPTEGLGALSKKQIQRVTTSAFNTKPLKDSGIDASSLLEEVQLTFKRTLNKMTLDQVLAKEKALNRTMTRDGENGDSKDADVDPAQSLTSSVQIASAFKRLRNLPVESQSTGEQPSKELVRGKVDTGISVDFAKYFNTFSFATLLTQSGVIISLEKITVDCNKVLQQRLFNTTMAKSVRVDEFQNLQNTATASMTSFLKESWTMAIKNNIRSSFKDVGKGWFNLREHSTEVYNCSKLKKFFKLVNCRMQDTLRFAIQSNLVSFVEFIEDAALADVEVVDACNVVISGRVSSRKAPLFATDLVLHVPDPKQQALALAQKQKEEAAAKALAEAKEDEEEDQENEAEEDDEEATEAKEAPKAARKRDPNSPHVTYGKDPRIFVDVPLSVFDHSIASMQKIPQVEKQVMDKLFWSFEPLLASVYAHEEWVQTLRERIREALLHAIKPMEDYLSTYDAHLDFVQVQIPDLMAEIEKECRLNTEEEEDEEEENLKDNAVPMNPHKLRDTILKHQEARKEIENNIPINISLGLFSVNCSSLRKLLAEKHQKIADNTMELLVNRTSECGQSLLKEFDKIHKELHRVSKTIEELTEMEQFMNTVPEKLRAMQAQINHQQECNDVLAGFNFSLPRVEFNQHWKILLSPKRISDAMESCAKRNLEQKKEYEQEQLGEQELFKQVLQQLEGDIESFSQHSDISRVQVVAQRVQDVRNRLDEAEKDANRFNSREVLFEKPITNYDAITTMNKDFEPYETLWLSCAEWIKSHEEWMQQRFLDLDADSIEKSVTALHRNILRCGKLFEKRGLTDIAAMGDDIRAQVEEFRPHIPIMVALRNPGMRDRHWERVHHQLGFSFDPTDEDFTLGKVLSPEFKFTDPANVEAIAKIGEIAAKEFQIEVSMDKMESEWTDVQLDIAPYKETGTFVLRSFDELQALLDEHITTTQAMMFSAFKGPFEERIAKWDHTLSLVSDVLDEWMAVQRNWLYLQPIFDSDDINKQLPTEGKRFATVDKNWRSTLQAAFNNPKAITFCPSEKLLDKWMESNKFLEMVSKGLSDYLETKRAGFSRFYFLSNDELLEILSQTKDPTMVQAHLKKCFEGIKSVTFDDNLLITQMCSSEGEIVDLATPIDPKGKNVEDWMTALDDMMKTSVKKVLYDSILLYLEIPRTDWIQRVAGQCAINGSQLHWTREIEDALLEKGAQGMVECFDQQVAQINDMVNLVRSPTLGKMARITLSAMTVIDVHARDVTEKLKLAEISNKEEFLWTSQMRFAWEGGEAMEGDMKVMMVSSIRPYGYEYLGNSFRLVITPLTDKCYLTLMGALQMVLGGAPAGPAGTGKTETTKDLAKALAKQCVVFNCSDGLDYLAMGKFFKGLASCGAWACFDEFNRIDVEVLSVVAQQIMTLQHAAKTKLDKLMFEGTMIRMNDQFAVYITMNPGYAGRTELPDNLKALFRPVAMMVPDYALIGEIMLYSFGYAKARKCAKKMVATFQLCSEQLSAQDHYDYGMRAVKTVIVAAGNLKRAEPDTEEEALLLRALQDVNLPKFLSHDLPLFQGIISDLFPGLSRPDIDYGQLSTCLKLSIEAMKLQAVPFFMEKSIQLYETIVVRHGLMLVGPTGGGKSCNVQCLDRTLGMLKDRGVTGFAFEKVIRHSVNPKSITMGQLYGEFDANTHEWQDGILASLVRECAKSTTPDRKWIMFDGPVDAIWIENMNTVLDDNKKLCLNSGEIMSLSPEITMMFEVEDLEVASPATVSRVGIVYMEPHTLGLEPIQRSWLEALPSTLRTEQVTQIQTLLDIYVASTISFLRRNMTEPVPTCDNNLNASILKYLDCYLAPFHLQEGSPPPSKAMLDELSRDLEAYFFFALIWSVCCTVDMQGRVQFDRFMRQMMEQNSATCLFPDQGLVYDYTWCVPRELQGGDAEEAPKKEWVEWIDTIPPYEYDFGLTFNEIIVPTQDSIRYTYLLNLLVRNEKHVLMCGPTGTGKSVNINQWLSGGMPSHFIPMCLTFSAQTSANQTQDIIDGKVEKRRKGVYGPPAGRKYVVFIDDLNMPKREEYFAQPPIEVVRQWFTYGGWYDRKSLQFMKLIDLIMVAAMGPPGGGRNPVTPRLKRHYTIINYTAIQSSSMRLIYNTILKNFLTNFDEGLTEIAEAVVDSSIKVYQTICDELLPTPAKSHYTYNLRDLGKVFQGVLMMDSKKVTECASFSRVWLHECRRVFRDRLINDEDREWFERLLESEITGSLQQIYPLVVTREPVLYVDFLNVGAEVTVYEEVEDLDALLPLVEEYLVDFNAESRQPMNLVMFMDAVEHVARISRVLRQPLGNVLLLGVGGSGRQSLTKLATFIADYESFQVEISKGYGMAEWREDMRQCLLMAGVEDKSIAFIFVDTQIIDEQMLEDINGVLNSGDIPNLYGPDDMERITSTFRLECQKKHIQPTKINIYSQFILRVKRNIHLCLCMSPGNAIFRDRLRMFPSLVNCTTIDWFSEWPEQALRSVGMGIMQEVDLKLGDHLDNIVELFKLFHQSVADASEEYFTVLRRYNYVTPTSYLELLNIFKVLLQKKRLEVGGLINRLQIGLDKLLSTSEMVSQLQVELTDMQPNLVKTQAEVEAMIIQIAKDKDAANETMVVVEQEEAVAQKKAEATKAIADDAQRDLDEALPALAQAVACLNKLKKADLDEVKSLKTPPKGVKLTMEAACIMFNVKPIMKNDPDKVGSKFKDYWDAAKKELLNNVNEFLSMLINFDKDNIPEKIIEQIQPYIDMPEFTPAEIEKASKACTAICMWSRAMYKYYNVSKAVEPKKALLAEAQEALDETLASLEESRSRLKGVQDRIAELEAEFEESNAKKVQLENDVEQCAARLDRAKKLIGGLGGERDRWTDSVAQLNVDYENLIGDVLISSGCIAYLGPFTSTFRRELIDSWLEQLVALRLPHTAGVDIVQTLGDPVVIRAWNIAGLPSDDHSTQNGCIMAEARRWPLLIDPQTQANRYIKNMGKDSANAPNGLEVIKLTDKNFIRALENGVRFGKWVLLENVGEKLDASLESILQQQTFKQGSQTMIRLGDSTIPYNDSFRFFITTKLPNPHYPPEVSVKVSLLNFSITPKGLEDQLLGVLMVTELPEKEEKKNALVVNNARMAKELKEIEDTILYMLSNSKGNILDDQELIDTLASSKVTSNEINVKVAEAKITEKEIDDEREHYRPVAFRGSLLFFCIADLRTIDPMYEYSLQMFTSLFKQGIINSEKPEDPTDIEARLTLLNDFFTYSLYQNICRSLFEKHKLLFSFSLIIKIMQGDHQIDDMEWRFLLSGQSGEKKTLAKPTGEDADWITDQVWSEILSLSGLAALAGFEEDFLPHVKEWKEFYDNETCYKQRLPGQWDEKLNLLEKLCVLRCIRPDKVVEGVQMFIMAQAGQRFIEPPPFEIEACFNDSNVTTPLIFVLTSGSDPTKDFMTFAEQQRRKVASISLGQGQGPLAKTLITEGMDRGSWILLQNCHLASSWMSELEQICEEIDPSVVHKDFRLWLTSMPSKTFPVSVLQAGVKMTKEPPKGLRANMKTAYYNLDDSKLNATNKPDMFKKLLFGLCFFHALIQERRKFGPLGWNNPYEFNDTDLDISISQLELYLNKYDEPPYEVLNVLTSYINYGGRVTDSIDLRTIDVILKEFYCKEVMEDDYKFSPSGVYYSVPIDPEAPHQGYVDYIESLPVNTDPEVFGMHENANITCALVETYDMFDTLMALQPRVSSGTGKTREEVIGESAAAIEQSLPEDFDIDGVAMNFPVMYNESMNTVLVQECIRYQKLLTEVKQTLAELQKALKGIVVLSSSLEAMSDSMYTQKVPVLWEAKAYPSMKPLDSWVQEFLLRLEFLREWVRDGTPTVYWISGFFFPQAFLTGTLQNYARKHVLPIDSISFSNLLLDTPLEDIKEKPVDGCYVRGLFLEGARWDPEQRSLAPSIPKVLYTSCPVIHFVPEENYTHPTSGFYRCPIYKILSRQGTLSTTGHSTNFIMWFLIPSNSRTITNNAGFPDQIEWIKAGVAAFCSLKF